MKRLTVIDTARGLAILFMLLNHAAWRIPGIDFRANYGWNTPPPNVQDHPEGWVNLLQGTPLFMLLSGVSIALFEAGRRKSGWSEWQITRYFLKRGALLIALDIFVIPWVVQPGHVVYESKFFILTSIALCLWAMAFLRYAPVPRLLLFAAALTLWCQGIYHLVAPADSDLMRSLLLYPSPADQIAVGYPFLAWLPVLCLGYASGRYVIRKPEQFRRHCAQVGGVGLLLWLAIVAGDSFGRLYHGHPLILTKHPPELAYLAFNTGAAYLILAALYKMPAPRFMAALGRKSLVFYVAHWYVLQLATGLFAHWLQGWLLYIFVCLSALLILWVFAIKPAQNQ